MTDAITTRIEDQTIGDAWVTGPYAQEEIAFIISTNTLLTAVEQAARLRRRYPSLRKVRARLIEMGQIAVAERAGHRPATPAEIEFIVQTYDTLTAAQQAAQLPGRSESRVLEWRSRLIQAGRLDPNTRKSHRPWSNDDTEELRSLVAEGLRIDTIAQRMKRSIATIYNHAAADGGLAALRSGMFQVRTKRDIERLFNVPPKVVGQWIAHGWLTATRNKVTRKRSRRACP